MLFCPPIVRYCQRTVTQDKGIPYQRHKPSAALREFLDPLDPGSYFDCGRARLHGLDDALLKEAESRGRTIGGDSFQLVATDMGLIFCRPSISFAIAARWDEVLLIRPDGDDPVVLPVTWPTHGELKFTVSKRLAGNVFRRWLQLRMQSARLARKEEDEGRAAGHELQYGAPAPSSVVPADGTPAPEWELVSKVGPADRTNPGGPPERPTHERRDTGVPSKRKQLDEAGVERRRNDRPTMLEVFEADTALPATERVGLETGVSMVDVAEAVAKAEAHSDGTAKATSTGEIEPAAEVEVDAAPAIERVLGNSDLPELPAVTESQVTVDVQSTGADKSAPENAATTEESASTDAHAWPSHSEATPASASFDAEDSTAAVSKEEPAPVAAESIEPDDTDAPGSDADLDESKDLIRKSDVPPPPSVFDSVIDLDRPVRAEAKRKATPPSWVGSPASLVAAVVVVSSFALILTLVLSAYQRSTETAVTVDAGDPAGPVVRTTIDHQRFKPGVEPPDPEGSAPFDPTEAAEATPSPAGAVDEAASTGQVLGTQPRLCNSNYSGCVPDVSDVDCPGDGDGPVYADGPAVVMGDDVYGLDTDGDGETCEVDQPPAEEDSSTDDQEAVTADPESSP